MSEKVTLARHITVEHLQSALNLVCFHDGDTVEAPEPICEWPDLCGRDGCKFPRYFRQGPAGLTAEVLIEVGFPVDLLMSLDREYELGEVLHPGVKIARSRNAALARLDKQGVALLSYIQDHTKIGWSWNDIAVAAFRPRRMIRRLDAPEAPVALLSIEDEMDRAQLGSPFVDDEAFEAWMQIWCDECNVDQCPLITVGAMNRTPAPWLVRDLAAVNKFTCAEFERSNAEDPTVVIADGQTTAL